MNGLRKHAHRHSGLLFSHKKEEILPFTTAWMDLEDINEISQAKKGKYCIKSHVKIERTQQTSEYINNKKIHRLKEIENNLVVTSVEKKREGKGNLGVGD